ncbi:kelch-like protein 26 isoform X3 [Schistocerca nitens]|uniref:kelch-like protein 26 isoform X3 n=1 Tax=Schistocerca nitens TaxID=7011 RepID=UPI002118F2D4|nr:kelch-like protein 26 isoform X3 [Schistocerca nitens]
MTRVREWGLQDRPLNTVHFESPSHTGTLLCGLNTLRSKGLLLDVTLVAEGEAFQAHRVVLASCSDYFRAMFTDAMRESRQSEICLNGVTAAGMRLLLDYAYTSRLALNLANIQDVLSAASHVQVVAVVEACSSYLQVLRIVIRWLSTLPAPTTADSCVQQRLPYAQRILRRVHFTEITPWDLDTVLSHSHMDQTLYRQVLAETCRQNRPRTLKLPIPSSTSLINSRGMELAVVKVGGFGIAGITNEITYFLPSVSKWRHLTSIPHVEQCNYGTAVLDNELYVVGGCFNQSLQENIHPFGFRYSPRYNKWTTMAPMQRERCRFSLNVVCGRLYAIGGASEVDDPDDEEEVSACECYDPQTDSWESIRPLPGHRSQHAGAAMPGGSLYISGGLDRDLVLSSMLCYDAVTDVWQQRAPMLTPRADHVMLVLGERLYVCGGWFEDADTGNRVLCETIDVYDVSANTWDVVTTVPTPRYHAGIVGVGSKIYFIGGFHSDAMFDRATAAIECYDLETDTWITGEKYPQDIWEHTCVTLYIPRCRDDMEVMATNDSRV